MDTRPLPEKETNIMTQGELDRLQESCSFPVRIQMRLLETDETITSTRLGEVAFHEAAFQVGLRLPIHPTLGESWPFTILAPLSWPLMHGGVWSTLWCCVDIKNTPSP